MTVLAIQGIRGSYSEEAALRLAGDEVTILECLDFAETFKAVTDYLVDYAVVPVENRIVGEIDSSMSIFRNSGLRIYDRMSLSVKHVLAGTPGADFDSIRSVRSHIEALKQCRKFLGLYPAWIQVIGADTASSIRRIVEEVSIECAAICSHRAVELYGARVIAEDIADNRDNWTTFCLIGI